MVAVVECVNQILTFLIGWKILKLVYRKYTFNKCFPLFQGLLRCGVVMLLLNLEWFYTLSNKNLISTKCVFFREELKMKWRKNIRELCFRNYLGKRSESGFRMIPCLGSNVLIWDKQINSNIKLTYLGLLLCRSYI